MLIVEGNPLKGQTDGDGKLEQQGELDGQINDDMIVAISAFCGECEIAPPPEGEITDEFRNKLEDVYGF